MIEITIIVVLLLAHLYFRPTIDIDGDNEQIIIHYWWRGVRKTYVL